MFSLSKTNFLSKKAWVISQAFLLLIAGCNLSKNEKPLTSQQKLYKKGKKVYMANCTECHHFDPNLDGALGPKVYGSSKELIYARIMTATYPQGYEPKRTTTMMVELPELEADIPAVHYFLNNENPLEFRTIAVCFFTKDLHHNLLRFILKRVNISATY